MKSSKKTPMLFGLFVASLLLFSFATGKGGENFQIYLNGKMIMQQFVSMDNSIKTLQLSSSSANDKLDIYYSHCGQTGTDRSITVKDQKGNALKTWKFANAKEKSAMTIMVRDIYSVLKNKETKFSLVYASKELPKGRSLAVVNLSNSSFAKN
jgi:hypothetical protein